MPRALAALQRLRRDRRGASILELGLVLPVIMVVLLGLIDVATLYSTQLSLQQAAARSLERVQVGNSRTDFAFVEAEARIAATAAGLPVDRVTVETWLECDQERQPPSTQYCPSGVQPPPSAPVQQARYVQVEIASTYQPYFPYSPLGARNASGNIPLTAKSSVRYQ
ncbi:MAG: TadE/TadG family type IV pilus assembly protein [Allosphingosinicella sp.]|uniref:TadE/TadG family type IV pilus assembly protein n=1 Tax=Allosphingosinicella sp. TaxID=2823234 RepID=UPI00393953BC